MLFGEHRLQRARKRQKLIAILGWYMYIERHNLAMSDLSTLQRQWQNNSIQSKYAFINWNQQTIATLTSHTNVHSNTLKSMAFELTSNQTAEKRVVFRLQMRSQTTFCLTWKWWQKKSDGSETPESLFIIMENRCECIHNVCVCDCTKRSDGVINIQRIIQVPGSCVHWFICLVMARHKTNVILFRWFVWFFSR